MDYEQTCTPVFSARSLGASKGHSPHHSVNKWVIGTTEGPCGFILHRLKVRVGDMAME